MSELDAESIALVKSMVLCQTPEMPAIQKIVMDGCVDRATRRMRFGHELKKRGMSLDVYTRELLDLVIGAWEKSDTAKATLASRTISILKVWPAFRLTGYGTFKREPTDWADRWRAAGESVCWQGAVIEPGAGPEWAMTALVASPIWAALGNGAGGFDDSFGWPHPPFAVGSSLFWKHVDWRQCRELGLT